jgi:hypothetical protein
LVMRLSHLVALPIFMTTMATGLATRQLKDDLLRIQAHPHGSISYGCL